LPPALPIFKESLSDTNTAQIVFAVPATMLNAGLIDLEVRLQTPGQYRSEFWAMHVLWPPGSKYAKKLDLRRHDGRDRRAAVDDQLTLPAEQVTGQT
jgi:hypothetical protein